METQHKNHKIGHFSITNKTDTKEAELSFYGVIADEWEWGDGVVKASDIAKEIKELPKDTNITIRVFSPGGSVYAGFAIYSLLAERKNNLTCIVDGLCASAATYILCACNKVKIGKTGQIMIHRCSGVSCGDAAALKKDAEQLEGLDKTLVDLYHEKTGRDKSEISSLMDSETWFTAEQALEFGFVDEIIKDDDAKENDDVMRAVALYNESCDGTANKKNYWKGNNITMDNVENKDVPAAAQNNKAQQEQNEQMQQEIARLKAENSALVQEKRNAKIKEVENYVGEAVAAGKIPAKDASQWVDMIVADENKKQLLDGIKPENKVTSTTTHVFETSSDPRTIINHIAKIPQNQGWQERKGLIRQNRESINNCIRNSGVLLNKIDTNHFRPNAQNAAYTSSVDGNLTVTSDLLFDVIDTNVMEEVFQPKLQPLTKLFTTRYEMGLSETDTMRIPFEPLFTQDNLGNTREFKYNSENPADVIGYAPTNMEYGITWKSVEVGKREYVDYSYSSEDFMRLKYIDFERMRIKMAKALGEKIWYRAFSLLTKANFPCKFGSGAKERDLYSKGAKRGVWNGGIDFDTLSIEDFNELKRFLDEMFWSTDPSDRNLVVNSALECEMKNKSTVVNSSVSGQTSTLFSNLNSAGGFPITVAPNLPETPFESGDNKPTLCGFVGMPSAMAMTTSFVTPNPYLLCTHSVVQDPLTGIALVNRVIPNDQKDTVEAISEMIVGFTVLEPKALMLLLKKPAQAS